MTGEGNGGTAEQPGYSNAFSRLYKGQDQETGEDDFVGALAYAYYKEQKREFVASNGLDTNHERVRKYHSDLGDIKAAQLRELAEKRLTDLLSDVAQRVEKDLREEVTEGHISDAFRANEARLTALQDKMAGLIQSNSAKLTDMEVLINKTDQNVKSGTALWRSIAAGVAASFVFGLVLTWARIIDWTNPFGTPPAKQQQQAPGSPPAN